MEQPARKEGSSGQKMSQSESPMMSIPRMVVLLFQKVVLRRRVRRRSDGQQGISGERLAEALMQIVED